MAVSISASLNFHLSGDAADNSFAFARQGGDRRGGGVWLLPHLPGIERCDLCFDVWSGIRRCIPRDSANLAVSNRARALQHALRVDLLIPMKEEKGDGKKKGTQRPVPFAPPVERD